MTHSQNTLQKPQKPSLKSPSTLKKTLKKHNFLMKCCELQTETFEMAKKIDLKKCDLIFLHSEFFVELKNQRPRQFYFSDLRHTNMHIDNCIITIKSTSNRFSDPFYIITNLGRKLDA
jgi:hypothetical protein